MKKSLCLAILLLFIPIVIFAAPKKTAKDPALIKKQQFVDSAVDKFFLDNGLDVHSNISSNATLKNGTKIYDTLEFIYPYWDRVMVYKITNGGDMGERSFLGILKKAGFRLIVFNNDRSSSNGGFVQVFDLEEGGSSIAK